MTSEPDPDKYRLNRTFVSFLRGALKQGGHIEFRNRQKLDLTRKQMDYRFEKMEEDGLIAVYYEDKEENKHGGKPQRIAVLTDAGEKIIEQWLRDNPVDVESVEAAGEEFVTRDHLHGELTEMGQRITWAEEDAKNAKEIADEALDHSKLMETFVLHLAEEMDMKRDLIRLKIRKEDEVSQNTQEPPKP